MKNLLLAMVFLTGVAVFAQTNTGQIAPAAAANIQTLLNAPAVVQPSKSTALGRSWFGLETDAHVFTDEVSFRQVAAVMTDLENMTAYYQGRRNKLEATIVQRIGGDTIMDFVAITPIMGFQIRSPYRALVRTVEKTETVISVEIRQLDSDSASNDGIRNFFTTRYAQAVTINGKTYTYIRCFISNDVYGRGFPGARNTAENSAEAANLESLQLLIAAAKTK